MSKVVPSPGRTTHRDVLPVLVRLLRGGLRVLLLQLALGLRVAGRLLREHLLGCGLLLLGEQLLPVVFRLGRVELRPCLGLPGCGRIRRGRVGCLERG
eukprot:SAG22_NODE_2856_length_2153_cov_1.616845_2_plen_98_part_00